MKKVLIGILILIPIIILLVVSLVTNLLQLQAWISVDDITVTDKISGAEVSSLKPAVDVGNGVVYDLNDFVDVVVLPDKANNYTVEWTMSEVKCSDEEYSERYEQYLENPTGAPVYPAAMLVDAAGNESERNTSGKFVVNAYCSFNIKVQAETASKNFVVDIIGNTVARVALNDLDGEQSCALTVGQSKRLSVSYIPLDSIVSEAEFSSSAPDVVTVDKNGVITAVGAGSAQITATADRYHEEGVVKSNAYLVTVTQGATRFGDSVTLNRKEGGKYDFEELEISRGNIDEAACEGCTVQDGGIVINGESAIVALKNGKTLEVTLCDEGAIVIDNAAHFASAGGYILGVDELGLKLSASYAATGDERTLENVVWSSDNEDVATVDANGLVKGMSDGETVIRATAGSVSASVEISVRNKVSSLRLKTSDESLKVGLARQTVFASDKFAYAEAALDDPNSRIKQPNGTLIHLLDEPAGGTPEEIANFYGKYNFKVVEGGEYAHMDATTPNLVVFDGAALEGKGVRQVKIEATAKYPRFETSTQNTTDNVTLNVVYGVEVSTFDQVVRASREQKEYALRPDNVIPEEMIDEVTAPNGQVYFAKMEQRAKQNYAMTLASNIAATCDRLDYYDDASCFALYGNLYGNGYMLSGKDSQIDEDLCDLVLVGNSDVTVSNVILRHNDKEIDKLDSKTFPYAYAVIVCPKLVSADAIGECRMTGIRIEYCVAENAHGAISLVGCDIDVVGCVFRNISSVGIFGYARVSESGHLCFSHLNLHNAVFSSIIGISVSMSFESYSSLSGGSGRYSSNPDKEASLAESYEFVENELVPRGFTHIFRQTGFLDIYNWQNAADVTLVDTGNKTYNDLLSQLTGPMITQHPIFAPGVYNSKGIDYFHLGFITAGIFMKKNVIERTFLTMELEDDRFFEIYTRDLTRIEGGDGFINLIIETVLKTLEVKLYCYKNTASITPESTYELNSNFITHLHEK